MSMRQQLIGVWSLQCYETKNSEGVVIHPFGDDATGFIMYHPDGYMSAQLMKQGRHAYASGDIHVGTLEELAEAAIGYMAYSGPFEINEATQTVTHHMDVSMNPTWLGQAQPRIGTIKDDLLYIKNGLHPDDQLIWKRCPKHS